MTEDAHLSVGCHGCLLGLQFKVVDPNPDSILRCLYSNGDFKIFSIFQLLLCVIKTDLKCDESNVISNPALYSLINVFQTFEHISEPTD